MGRPQILHVGGVVGSSAPVATRIEVDDGIITALDDRTSASGEDLRHLTAVPGFVDMHCHGGGGHHFGDGPDAARSAARVHLEHGTTTIVGSLVSAPPGTLIEQLQSVRPVVDEGVVAGIHLEGPWISPGRRGAHDPAVLRASTPEEVDALLGIGDGLLTMVTLAPELEGGLAAVHQWSSRGVVVAIGHTEATREQAQAAIDRGATVATHLFNAMPPLDHRAPGPIGALLHDPRVTVELIADTVHVHPDVLGIAMKAAGPDRVALVTDAMAAAGAQDGRYHLGSLDVEVSQGVARVADSGALAGSTLTMDRALRHAVVDAGWALPDAVRASSSTPARTLGLTDRGLLAPGLRADIVLLDDDLRVRGVMRGGVWEVDPA